MHIKSSAPTRVDLAGGTIDIWPLYLFHAGAATVNFATSLRASCQIKTREDGRIVLESRDRKQSSLPSKIWCARNVSS
jgi:D-glycero-alpha-D-manno-heptose-7-phosphate kinase